MRVSAEVGVNGLDRRRRYERIPVIRLGAKEIDPQLAAREIEGYPPLGVPTTFMPKLAEPTHRLRPQKGKDLDPGGTIFGTDDRYLFDDRLLPLANHGQGQNRRQVGVRDDDRPSPRAHRQPRGQLDRRRRRRRRMAHLHARLLRRQRAVGRDCRDPGHLLGAGAGQLTDQQTAFDYVVLVMEERIGDIVGYPGYRTYDDDWNGGRYWQYIGYPGELSSGERPAFQGDGVVSSVGEESLSGQTGYVMGHFNEFTPGQSGGAVWGWWGEEPWPRVVGVGSTIGSTAVQQPTGSTTGDNEYGGGPALSALI